MLHNESLYSLIYTYIKRKYIETDNKQLTFDIVEGYYF